MNGHKPPTCSGPSYLILEHKEATPNSLKVQFRRPKKIVDGGDNNFTVSDTINDMIYAFTESDYPQKHKDDFGSFVLDFSKGGDIDTPASRRSKFGDGTFMLHQHGMPIV